MNHIRFTNENPAEMNCLGEITWIAKKECRNCGILENKDIKINSFYYDGFRRECPSCLKCGTELEGYPEYSSMSLALKHQMNK